MKTELEKYGYYVSRSKVARMMKSSYFVVKRTRELKVTTDSKYNYPVVPNILNQSLVYIGKPSMAAC